MRKSRMTAVMLCAAFGLAGALAPIAPVAEAAEWDCDPTQKGQYCGWNCTKLCGPLFPGACCEKESVYYPG